MRRRHKQVILEVSATRHEIAVFENGVLLGHRSSRLSPGETEAEWAEGIRTLEAEVTAWVAEFDIAGWQTTVVYNGPDTAVLVHDCPVKVGESRAKLAAKGAVSGTISYPIDQNAHGEFCVFKDSSVPEGEEPKFRTLAMVDTDATLMSLSLALERAGLCPTSFVPAQGASLAAAIKMFSEHMAADAARIVLWVGEHSSVIIAGVGERIVLARLVPVGIETFIEALARPVVTGESRAAPLMNREVAFDLLFTSGIPIIDEQSKSSTSFDVRSVLPLVQSSLQRLIVELKQSIRFGLESKARAHATLLLCGPGSQISGLKESIVGGVGLDAEEPSSVNDSLNSEIRGDIAAVLTLGSKVPALVTREFATQRVVNTTRRALWIGASMAILAIGADVNNSLSRSSTARQSLEQVASETSPLVSIGDQRMQLAIAARHGLNHAKARERTLFGSTPSYGAVLAALSALTPEEVFLTEIAFAKEGGSARCTIRGWSVADDEMTETDRFRAFTVAIRSCPLIADTTLGETRRTQEHDRQTLSFSMTLDLVELPVGFVRTGGVEDAGDSLP